VIVLLWLLSSWLCAYRLTRRPHAPFADHARLVWFERARHESLYLHDPEHYREALGA
jgi:hypothetical protein